MIFVDPLFVGVESNDVAARVGAKHGHRWCHMWHEGEDPEELHRFAAKIGLRRSWFQSNSVLPHYDLVPTKRALAIAYGAQIKDPKDTLRSMREAAVQRSLPIGIGGGMAKDKK